MGSEIKVTFSALERASVDTVATTARINSQLEDLRRYLAPMVGAWTGDAASTYQASQQKWDTSAAELTTTLGTIGKLVGQAGQNYRATEQANRARFACPPVRGPGRPPCVRPRNRRVRLALVVQRWRPAGAVLRRQRRDRASLRRPPAAR
ncbi:WXG100 family type VII secretion target [Pseudonocardia sp. ICBG601]|uniref:WXG100 family type VII secretion target n=1 Tax=Pseudonocardia sp. ICBG601 TaxID=2846759 RepID=UPI001CF6C289|nr:WXG100 family type VII secretion target [Pseudonocardia sp. ICBG601]